MKSCILHPELAFGCVQNAEYAPRVTSKYHARRKTLPACGTGGAALTMFEADALRNFRERHIFMYFRGMIRSVDR